MLLFSIWLKIFLQNTSSCCNLDKVSLLIGNFLKSLLEVSLFFVSNGTSQLVSTLDTYNVGNESNV